MFDNRYPYYFFVEYLEAGDDEPWSDTWSEGTLNEALHNPDITILHISLAYTVQKALGLVDD